MRPLLPIFCACLVFTTGCASKYQLQGTVVQGPAPMVIVLDASDPRLNRDGLAGAQVELTLDPDSLGRKIIGVTTTDQDGHFILPVGEFGAGVLQYQVGLTARSNGFRSHTGNFIVPSQDKRVLIMLSPGADPPRQEWDVPDNINRRLGP